MGCVRDLIKPQHFMQNVINFHQQTGARVIIVSYDQKAKRRLWRGLTHDEFVKTLKELIPPSATTPTHQELTGANTSTPCPSDHLPASPRGSIQCQSVVSDVSQSSVSESDGDTTHSPATTPEVLSTPSPPYSTSPPHSPFQGFATPNTDKLNYITAKIGISKVSPFLGNMTNFPPLVIK
jgi:hypothetical protein